MGQAPVAGALQTVRVSPRNRISGLPDTSIPTLPPGAIEPFLEEGIIVGENELALAPRIVAATDDRVMLSRGDRAYVRGRTGTPLVERDPRKIDAYRVFRSARVLKDPLTGNVLGYEAHYLGNAELVRSESVQPVRAKDGQDVPTVVPATIDIVRAKEEMRVGDRLLPEPGRQLTSYVPRAPAADIAGSIVSVYGDAVALAGQNQVVVINKGAADGLETGQRDGDPERRPPDRRPVPGRRARPDQAARRAQWPADGVPHVREALLRIGAGHQRYRAGGRPGRHAPLSRASSPPWSATSSRPG